MLTSVVRRTSLPLSLLQRHFSLIKTLVRREVIGRYRGSLLGIIWSLVNPVLMLAVYSFVFTVVFKARWIKGSSDKFEFAMVLFCGLIVFNLFSDCISRAPGLILSNVNYVKKVIFPLEILPWVSVGAGLFHAGINIVVLLFFLLLIGHETHPTILFFPIVLAPLVLVILGFSWLLASLGVFVRDMGQIIGFILTVLMFMSPVFYPVSDLPEGIREFLFLNPLTFVIEQFREVMLWGHAPDWVGLGFYACMALLVASAGLFWFEKTRKGFSDVL